MSLRAFAEHSHLAHAWIDVEDAEEVDELLASMGLDAQDIPAVITATETLRRPSAAMFAEHLGLTFHPTPGYMFDLVVVGSGPAGLAAAVYGASEGLRTVSLDAVAVGGQAGSSSRIENYAGFPNGISGEALTGRAAVQAMRLGARLNAPCEVAGPAHRGGLSRRSCCATAARSRRARSSSPPARATGGWPSRTSSASRAPASTTRRPTSRRASATARSVLVIGGGNSAGQAAIYLAQSNCGVTIAIRRDELTRDMSQYLIERIEADPQNRADHRRRSAGPRRRGASRAGDAQARRDGRAADARLRWACSASSARAPRPRGSETGSRSTETASCSPTASCRQSAARGYSTALPFETSVRGVFAAGDVRHGSMKRVAAAVGEGSSAVRSVHERLATLA